MTIKLSSAQSKTLEACRAAVAAADAALRDREAAQLEVTQARQEAGVTLAEVSAALERAQSELSAALSDPTTPLGKLDSISADVQARIESLAGRASTLASRLDALDVRAEQLAVIADDDCPRDGSGRIIPADALATLQRRASSARRAYWQAVERTARELADGGDTLGALLLAAAVAYQRTSSRRDALAEGLELAADQLAAQMEAVAGEFAV